MVVKALDCCLKEQGLVLPQAFCVTVGDPFNRSVPQFAICKNGISDDMFSEALIFLTVLAFIFCVYICQIPCKAQS